METEKVRELVGTDMVAKLDGLAEGSGVAWEQVFISFLMTSRELDVAAAVVCTFAG